jgi:hypothetical protein
MPTPAVLFGIAIAVVLVLLAVVALATHRGKSVLRERFGPEYERAVEEYGGHKAAEKELRARERRLSKLRVRPLNERQRQHVMMEWLNIQSKFVDNPAGAARSASALVKMVLQERGYPSEPFEQRLADLSVNHARVVQHYRAARALTDDHPKGEVATEDLRQALVHYRIILEELSEPSNTEAARFHEARAH